MENLIIVCVDDQREVLSALSEDLTDFEEYLTIEECESVAEAWEVIEEIESQGDYLPLVISDHVMPVKTGIEFLSELENDGRFDRTRKILLTGLATHQDTIQAINKSRLDFYVEKPWDKAHLKHMISELLTTFILETGIDYQKYQGIIDQTTLYEHLRKGG